MTSNSLLTTLSSLILIGFLVTACNTASTTETKENPSESPAIDSGERKLDKETFAAAIKKSGAVVVDVRMPGEFEQGHIEGAININFFDPEFKYKLLELNKSKKYYLYCKNETRSYRSMKFMEDNDFKNVYMLEGGYEDWNTARAE